MTKNELWAITGETDLILPKPKPKKDVKRDVIKFGIGISIGIFLLEVITNWSFT